MTRNNTNQCMTNQTFELNRRNSISLNNTVSVNCTTDRNIHVSDHGSVKDCNVKLLSYYNIAITTKSKRPLNIVRRYQKNVIANQKSTDHDNNDRKKHGQTQFTHSEDRKLKTVNTKSEQ